MLKKLITVSTIVLFSSLAGANEPNEDSRIINLNSNEVVVLGTSTVRCNASEVITENVAVLIARAYVVGVQYQFDGNLNDEVYKADKINSSSYEFLVQDSSGDCGLNIVINFDGSIDQGKTVESCL